MGEHYLTGKSGRTYKVFPRDIAWHLDAELDHIDDFKDVVLIVGRIEGDQFIPMDVDFCKDSILPYFKYRALEDHIVKRTGSTHFATIWIPEPEGKLAYEDLREAYPRGGRP